MAKRKKKKKKRSSGRSQSHSSSGARWLEKQMAKVDQLEQAQAYEEAFELLLAMEKRYPRHPDVLGMLINIAAEMKNWKRIMIYSLRLYPMETGNDRAAVLNNLLAASVELQLPALASQTASILLEDHPNFYLIKSVKQVMQIMQPNLLQSFAQMGSLSEKFDHDQAKILDFMAEHDRMTFFADIGKSKETIFYCQRLLAEFPSFIPALNNISLAYFREGDLDKAIETTQNVLIRDPDNFHALANLTRYSFLKGETNVAWSHARQLKRLEHDEPQRWVKQAETLAYLGDDEGVRDAYLEAQQHDFLPSPLLLHLAAAAYYRLGHESKAWGLWEEALRIDPSFDLAKANLAERAKEAHERHTGWYWPLDYWFAGDIAASLQQFLPNRQYKGAVKKGIQKLLKRYPQLPILAAHILQCGDPVARKTLCSLIELAKRADLSRALLLFGLSQYGPDIERINALQFLAKHHADMLPTDRKVIVWHQGEQKEIILLAFQMATKPKESGLDDQMYKVFLQAHHYLNQNRDLKRAEESFTKVIKAYPHFTGAYNQLTLVYQLQGRFQEANALVKLTHHRFPDYAFARIHLARLAIQDNRLDEARELLNPVVQQKEIHVSELRALAQAEIEYALAIERQDAARIWLDMWQSVEKTHPDIPAWRARIEESNRPARQIERSPEERRRLARKVLEELGL